MSATGRPFVLDRVENPHPRMLREGWELRLAAATPHLGASKRVWAGHRDKVQRWKGYLQAMCAATGCSEADILAWMDRHPVSPSS